MCAKREQFPAWLGFSPHYLKYGKVLAFLVHML